MTRFVSVFNSLRCASTFERIQNEPLRIVNLSQITKRPMMQYDTIVVGLGAAGVTAASTLAKAGRRVLGLEAQDRIGGRVNTVPFGDGVVELGAEWIHGQKGSRVYETAIRNNVTVLSQDLTVDVYRSDGSKGDAAIVNELMDYSLSIVEEAVNETVPLGQFLARKIMEHIKKTKPHLLEDSDFIESFLDLMDLVVDNYEGSDSWNDVSSQTKYRELEGDQHVSWHRHGYKTFFELMLNTYRGGPGLPNLDLKLNAEVLKIVWPQQPSDPVQVTCKDGQTYRANNVIVTVSVGVLKDRYQTLFEPPLPEFKSLAISRIAFGSVDKVVLAFPTRWWPSSNVYWFRRTKSERAKALNETGWVTYFASCGMGSPNTITLWHTGHTARLVETIPEEVVKRKSVELLQKFLGANVTVPEPTGMLRTTWYLNPYTRGSYTFDSVESAKYPNSREDLGRPLVDSAGTPRVLFAGEATNLVHFSTVHGASETGYREAMRLLPSSKI